MYRFFKKHAGSIYLFILQVMKLILPKFMINITNVLSSFTSNKNITLTITLMATGIFSYLIWMKWWSSRIQRSIHTLQIMQNNNFIEIQSIYLSFIASTQVNEGCKWKLLSLRTYILTVIEVKKLIPNRDWRSKTLKRTFDRTIEVHAY